MIVAFALAALAVFDGFTSYMYTTIEEMVVYSGALGHIEISTREYASTDSALTAAAMIPAAVAADLEQKLRQHPAVITVAPKIRVTGLLSNGQKSMPFRANGMRFEDRLTMFAQAEGVIATFVEDQLAEPPTPDFGIRVAEGLAALLDVKIGADVAAMSSTLDGYVNALDFEVYGLFSIPQAELNSLIALMSLERAQLLYDTDAVDRMGVLLKRGTDLDAFAAELQSSLHEYGPDLIARTWMQRDALFSSVQLMFETIFFFMFMIILVIIGLAVTVTVSMSVAERTHEFGAMRAIGLTRLGQVRLIATESALLGVVSAIAGAALFFLVDSYVDSRNIRWTPPMFSVDLPLQVYANWSHVAVIAVTLIGLMAVVGAFAAATAARKSIVDALGHY
ncbi:MAG: ABC transporter permease [Oceanococcus sp.]